MSTQLLKSGYSLILGVTNYTPKIRKFRKTAYAPIVRSGSMIGVNSYWLSQEWDYNRNSKKVTRMNVSFRDRRGRFVPWSLVEDYASQINSDAGIKLMKMLRGLPAHD